MAPDTELPPPGHPTVYHPIRARSRPNCASIPGNVFASWLLILAVSLLLQPAQAAFLAFQNCLDDNIVNSKPRLLQFVPLNFSATFNLSQPTFPLNVTAYGNVTGLETSQPYPAPNDPQWSNPNDTVGKIVDLSASNNKYTTMFTTFDFLSYTAYSAPPSRFCSYSLHGPCPLGPAFYVDPTDIQRLPAFSVSHEMGSSYAFTSITATMRITSGDASNQPLGCVSATVTPDLGSPLKTVLRYIPLVILITVGAATLFAATLSPWGSPTDIFRATSNYGHDVDLLRLVTPGFGDCLQYIQFVVLTGSLSLNYPGFYQPVVSQVGWSSLMFNESFVSGGSGIPSVVDGVYQLRTSSTYGLDQMSQLVGMKSDRDIWVGMVVWLVVIIAAVCVLIQAGFAYRWLYRRLTNVWAEDLRSKNWSFTAGNIIRIVFNYFLLPLISLSMFQLVIAGQGPAYSVAIAAILLVAVILFAVRLLFLFSRIRQRSVLFDDLPTLLLWGPLYNTYCDDQPGFALLPILLNFLRGIAIGAVQPSGIAQLILLAICEVIFALTLNFVRPFYPATSMNIYHTCFAIIRLVAILLSVAFVPSLGVADSIRGWIGYVVLLLHAGVLVFGFFINAIQTIVEVAARLAGAGGRSDSAAGATRGGLTRVFGMRQLSRRVPRPDAASRRSLGSHGTMLSPDPEAKSMQFENTRVKSTSGSSMLLLNQHLGDGRMSQALGGASPSGTFGNVSPSIHDASSNHSRAMGSVNRMSDGVSPGGIVGIQQPPENPYFRKPRRATFGSASPTVRDDAANKRRSIPIKSSRSPDEGAGEGPSNSGRATPVPSAKGQNEDFEDIGSDLTRPRKDYAVREVDFYYRAPLSSGTRKLKTGPTDPTGPVSSATGWFKGLFGGKSKEKNTGFEVLRSARAPPELMIMADGRVDTANRPYMDVENDAYNDEEDETGKARAAALHSLDPENTGPDGSYSRPKEDVNHRQSASSPEPPELPAIEAGGAIELPSRVGSLSSKVSAEPRVPSIPRRSSKRTSQDAAMPSLRLPIVPASLHSTPVKKEKEPAKKRESYWPVHKISGQLAPPGSRRIPFASGQGSSSMSNRHSTGAESTVSSNLQFADENEHHAPGFSFGEGSPSVLGPDTLGDRPSSVGYVNQHRASDHIHHSPDSPEYAGNTAEFVGSQN